MTKSVDDTSMILTSQKVSLPRVTAALMDTLQTTVSLLNLPKMETDAVRASADKVIERIVYSAVEYKSVGEGETMESSPSIFSGKPSARNSQDGVSALVANANAMPAN